MIKGLARRFARPELLIVAVYAVILSYISALRYRSFTDAWDFGGFVQAIWSTVHGYPLSYTLNSFFYVGFPVRMVHSFLGTHFSLILFLMVPFYAVFPDPVTLLVVQSVAVSLGVLPIYWLARRNFSLTVSLAFVLVYLIYPPMLGLSLNNFHPEAFIPTLMMFALYSSTSGKWAGAFISSALLMSVIEQGGYLVTGMALFLCIYYKVWRRRELLPRLLLLAAIGTAYAILATYARTAFGLDPTGYTVSLNSGNFNVLGVNFPEQVPLGILEHPARAMQALQYDSAGKVFWLFSLLGPLMLLPLLYPEALIVAVPYLLITLFSNYPGYYSTYGIEQSFVIGAMFPAAILGLQRVKLKPAQARRVIVVMLVYALVLAALLDFPPGVYGSSFQVGSTAQIESKFVSLIPNGASVLTTSDIFPSLANRLDAFVVPPSSLRPFYASIDKSILNAIQPPEFVMLSFATSSGNVQLESNVLLDYVLKNTNYGILAYNNKVMLFELGYHGNPIIEVYPTEFNSTNLSYGPPTLRNGAELVFPGGSNAKTFWFGPYSFLPPGNYTVAYNLTALSVSSQSAPILRIDAVWNLSNSVLAQKILYPADFKAGQGDFVLQFSIPHPIFDIEFRGVFPGNSTSVTLDSIVVTRR